MNKNRILQSIFLIFIFFVFGFMGCASNNQIGKILNVQLYAQETEVWCWAASAQMIMCYHGKKVSQGQQVNDFLQDYSQNPDIDCCQSPKHELCLVPGLVPALPDFSSYGFRSDWGFALSWKNLKKEIDNKRPFGFSWIIDSISSQLTQLTQAQIDSVDSGGGHYMVAIGYQEENGNKYVWIIDPWAFDGEIKAERITFEEYLRDEGYSHYIDHYEIMKNDQY